MDADIYPHPSSHPHTDHSLFASIMTISALRALHAVIGNAIDTIEREYSTQSSLTGLPLDYPSLDEPYYSNLPGQPAATAKESEALRLEPAVFGAANEIVAACGQLTATVHKPFFSLVEGLNGVRLPLPAGTWVSTLTGEGWGRRGTL